MTSTADLDATVLITGSTGAIGSATVTAFLAAGLTVLGLDRAEPPLASNRFHHVTTDLADASSISAALKTLESLPPLLHVVAIAGGALPEEPVTQDEPWTISPELFRASVEANLTTQFLSARAAIPHLLAQQEVDRSITFMSSFNALTAQGMVSYSAAKAGLIGMMYGLVGPLGAAGVRVNVAAPGTVSTPRTMDLWSRNPGHFDRLRSTTAMGRIAEPSDVADAVLALALSLRHVTAQVLTIDGGQSAAIRQHPSRDP